MKQYSQRDKRWKDIQLGDCNGVTIGSQGCKISCIGMLTDTPPDLVNVRFLESGKYVNGCNVADATIPSVFPQLELTDRFPKIAEVKVPKGQHFVVALDNKYIIDPWTGASGLNPYTILNYRNITPKIGGTMPDYVDNFIQLPKSEKVYQEVGKLEIIIGKTINKPYSIEAMKKADNPDVFQKANTMETIDENQMTIIEDKVCPVCPSLPPPCEPCVVPKCPPCDNKDLKDQILKLEGSLNQGLDRYTFGQLIKAAGRKLLNFIDKEKK